MKLQITLRGPIAAISDAQVFGSGFRKRQFVVTNIDDKDPKWNQPIGFELHKDHCDKLDAFKLGDEIEVTADVLGNEHNGRHYIALRAWKLVKLDANGDPMTGRTMSPDRGDPMEEHERNRARQTATKPSAGNEDGMDW